MRIIRWLLDPGPRYSWKKVALILAASAFFCLLSSLLFLVYEFRNLHRFSPLEAIVQTGPPLPVNFAAEILGLSADHKTNLNRFDVKKAKQQMTSHPIIRRAEVSILKPNAIHVDYGIRDPIAQICDFSNTCIDSEGILIPHFPFYSPRHLPKVCAGPAVDSQPWGKALPKYLTSYILDLLNLLNETKVEMIDLSRVEDPSLGKREIIVAIEEEANKHLIRLTPKRFMEELKLYAMLKEKKILQRDLIIDLRLNKMAFVKTFVTIHPP